MGRLKQIEESRLEKLEQVKKAGMDPYPAQTSRSTKIGKLDKELEKFIGKDATICGRVIAIRGHGKSSFADIKDDSGEFQLLLKEEKLKKDFAPWQFFDIGDFVEASGEVVKTKTGQPTLQVAKFRMLAKSLKPLPDQRKGLKDTESRLRKRYLDILINPKVREIFEKRSALSWNLRRFYEQKGYISVDTPVLQSQAGGAIAEPFKTKHRRLGIDLYLRIAAELYLKRLMVAGYEKVYELGPVFRNEGMDPEHLQEFYMLESYEAYADYEDYMKFTEEMLEFVLRESFGQTKFKYQGKEIDFKTPWPRLDYSELVKKDCGINIDDWPKKEDLLKEIAKKKIKLDLPKDYSWGKLVDELYKTVSRPKITGPAFLINHPLALSPLAKKQEDNSQKVQRYQVLVAGYELVNGFSELNDPLDQEQRFRDQVEEREAGDKEAHVMDEDYVEALKYGMPPTAGLGIGLDRLLAIACDLPNLRESILFPTLKPNQDGK